MPVVALLGSSLLISSSSPAPIAVSVVDIPGGGQLSIDLAECTGCGACVEADPNGAFYIDEDGKVWVYRSLLTFDGAETAAEVCTNGVLMVHD